MNGSNRAARDGIAAALADHVAVAQVVGATLCRCGAAAQDMKTHQADVIMAHKDI